MSFLTKRDGTRGRHDYSVQGRPARRLYGLAAAAKRKPTVAQYTLYFSYLQVASFANGSEPNGEPICHQLIVMFGNFPEKTSSRESLSLLVLLSHSDLTVGFRFAAAANPKWAAFCLACELILLGRAAWLAIACPVRRHGR